MVLIQDGFGYSDGLTNRGDRRNWDSVCDELHHNYLSLLGALAESFCIYVEINFGK